MFRVSTSEFVYELPEDLEYTKVRVSFKQRTNVFAKELVVGGSVDSGIVAEGNTVVVSLTEEETATFRPGLAYTQIKVLAADERVLISDEFRIIVQATEDDTIMSGGE